MGQEDFGGAHPDGVDGASGASTRSEAGGGRTTTEAVVVLDCDRARFDPGAIATQARPASRRCGEPGSHLALVEAACAQERDTEENLERRREFLELIATIDLERLLFLDESGITTTMTRLYGRAAAGQRVHEATPQSHWTVVTLIGALRVSGMVAPMTVEAATDGEIFLAYVEHFLCPELRPEDVVIMDNLSAHKVDGVRQLIETTGARLLYLPPYSPDLNPIEKAWSKIKQILRALKARSTETLDQAITEALIHITPDNARAWFRPCTTVYSKS